MGRPRLGRGVVGRWSRARSYPQGRCSMLELHASKGARAVLRGGGAGDSTSLPDYRNPGGPQRRRRSLTIGTRAVASGIMRVEEGDRLRRG